MTKPTPEQISVMVHRLKTMSVAAKAYATTAQGIVFSAAFDDAASMLAAIETTPDPRDAVLARLVEALESCPPKKRWALVR